MRAYLFPFVLMSKCFSFSFPCQVNEGVRSQENTDRLEWLQHHVNLEGIGEVSGAAASASPRQLDGYFFSVITPGYSAVLCCAVLRSAVP